MTQPEPTRGADVSSPHRPQSMSDAVEVAARAHHDAYERLAPTLGYETREATRVPWDDLKTDMRLLMVESEAEALSAIGLPELLSEVERLRGVAEAARELLNADTDMESTGATSGIAIRYMRARQDVHAALASEDKT